MSNFKVGDKVDQKDLQFLFKELGRPPFEVVAIQNRDGEDYIFLETDPCFTWYPSKYFKLYEETQNKWVPVKEGLPEFASGSVLVTIDKEDFSCVIASYWSKPLSTSRGKTLTNVTAWMKYPEPYKAK